MQLQISSKIWSLRAFLKRMNRVILWAHSAGKQLLCPYVPLKQVGLALLRMWQCEYPCSGCIGREQQPTVPCTLSKHGRLLLGIFHRAQVSQELVREGAKEGLSKKITR